MARIRTIKPDAFTSDSLSSVPRGTRWTFAGLWTYADDAGRGRDDARLIKAALYPIDDDTTLADVAHDLDLLASIGGICRYVVDGRRYLHMPKWGHQKINRPTPAKSPPCPLHEDGGSGHVLDAEPSVTAHGGLSEGSTWEREGKGREGDREGEVSDAADADADAPKGRQLALIEKRPDVERICEHLAGRIEANGSKRPTITKGWRDAARLMLDRDRIAEADVIACIDWCQRDEFWRANVLSLPKLREKYDQLRLQARRANGSNRQADTDDLFARAAERMGVKGAIQ
jgi:hypothetical protein